jgi:cytochrome P450
MVTATLTQPLPRHAPGRLPVRALLDALRGNALAAFPREAFFEDVVVQTFFGRRHVILSRPDAIHHVLVDQPQNYAKAEAAARILRPMLGRGLFLSSGDDWRQQRRTVSAGFAPRAVRLLAGNVAETLGELTEELALQEGQPLDFVPVFQTLALEIIGRAIFSLDMKRHAPELRELILNYAARFGRPSLADFLLPLGVPTLSDLGRRRFRRRWRRLVTEIITERHAARADGDGNGPPRDLFDVLATAAQDDERPIERLGDQVATFIVAGHETTASAMFWACYLLASHPDVQERIAAEAAAFSLSPDDAAETVPQLIYTRAVVDEVLRLYPPAFVITRQAVVDDFVAGIPVPKRSLVLIAPWVVHRHRRFWNDPDRFDPDRFLPDRSPPARFAYLPFGSGARTCVGSPFALTELVLVLAILMRNFRMALAPHAPVNPVGLTTIQPDRPPPFLLQRR